MKTITTLLATAALIGGISVASAQQTPSQKMDEQAGGHIGVQKARNAGYTVQQGQHLRLGPDLGLARSVRGGGGDLHHGRQRLVAPLPKPDRNLRAALQKASFHQPGIGTGVHRPDATAPGPTRIRRRLRRAAGRWRCLSREAREGSFMRPSAGLSRCTARAKSAANQANKNCVHVTASRARQTAAGSAAQPVAGYELTRICSDARSLRYSAWQYSIGRPDRS